MEILPGFVQRSLRTASKLRDQFYDQVGEAQDVVQDVTDFIVHSRVNKKEVRASLQQRLDARWTRIQDLERELEDEKAYNQAALATQEAELRCLRPEVLQLQQQLCDEQAAYGKTREELRQVQALLSSSKSAHSATQALLSSEQAAHATTRQQLQQAQEAEAAARAGALHQLQSAAAQARDQAAEHQLAVQRIGAGHAQQIQDLHTQHAGDLQRQREQVEGALVKLQSKREAALRARHAEAAAAQVQAEAQAHREQLHQVRAELDSVRIGQAASQTAGILAEAKLLGAHQELQQVQADLQQVQAELQHERRQRAADLRAAAVQAQAGLQAERQRHAATQAAVTRLRGELEGERQRRAAAQPPAGVAAQHAAAKAANTQLQRVTEQLAAANARAAALQADLAAREEEIQRLQQGQSSDEEGDGHSTTDDEGGNEEEDDGEHRAVLGALKRVLLPSMHTPTPGTLADCLATLLEAFKEEEEPHEKECEIEFKRVAAEGNYKMSRIPLGRGGHAITYSAHKTEDSGQRVAIRFEDKQWDILGTLRDAVMDALYEAQSEVTRAVEVLKHAHSNSLAVRDMGLTGVVTVHHASLQETSPGEALRLMTVMSIAGTQTVMEWVQQQRNRYTDGFEHFVRRCLSIICQMAQTLASLEGQRYHGVDLKVDNVLISPGVKGWRPVLIDCFEGWFSHETEGMRRLGVPATYTYAAPEVLAFLDKLEAGSSLTDGALSASDLSRAEVWCLGVALAWMLSPRYDGVPFGHEDRAPVQQAQSQWLENRDGPPLSEILEHCTKKNLDSKLAKLVEEVLRKCWEEKDKRCRAVQLAALIQRRLRR